MAEKKGVHEYMALNCVKHYLISIQKVYEASEALPNVHNCVLYVSEERKINNLKISIGISHNHTDNNLHFLQRIT
jgi:hypothetical protein